MQPPIFGNIFKVHLNTNSLIFTSKRRYTSILLDNTVNLEFAIITLTKIVKALEIVAIEIFLLQ